MSESSVADDAHLASMREARSVPAVLKLQLAKIRSSDPDRPIFAFEGDDDKYIYYQWIRRIRSELKYEPFPCTGKGALLALIGVIRRDQTNIGVGVYFFFDRDFDDWRGSEPHENAFMTDRYSVENYLVSSDVLDELLANEFNCHGDRELRSRLIALFERSYSEFLEVTRDLNRKIFVARRANIDLGGRIPSKISAIAKVGISGSERVEMNLEAMFPFSVEEIGVDLDQIDREFRELTPALRYRGKFAMLFWNRWLSMLVDEYNSGEKGVFEARIRGKVRASELTLSTFASKSSFPEGLEQFVMRVAA